MGDGSTADRWSTADQPALAEPPAQWSREGLRQRLDSLPAWHPSSPGSGYAGSRDTPDQLKQFGRVDVPRGRPEPLTDAEHADRVRNIRDRLGWARDQMLTTEQQHLVDRKRGIWSRDRRDTHDAIVGDLCEAVSNVPCEHQAIMAGGLGGAGKSTVLEKHAGIDRSQYLTINPDGIMEEMAKRGLIPELSSTLTAEQRLDDLDRAGYSTQGVFVDISIGEAVQRADARYRGGHEDYRAGIGFGGRYVPPEVIEAQADPEQGSRNRRTFEQVKSRFTDWAVYDNSVTGRDPELIQAGHGRKREEER